ncbi:ComF family protein [Catalinimonas alkaloidigena]|uniref:ComF family protein n=1 Tax=Catalinimonas alkaloidigena TaxID=1075417 RepID=UPI0024074F9E|nr:ComF family protein [Catalinimonas alkaloidigena]MDF9800573.1 ComF family protein [Catalinimonas alkaloidigena]
MFNDFISLLFPHCCVVSKLPLAKGEQYISTSFANALPKYDLHHTNVNLERKFSGLVDIKYVLVYYKFSKKSGVQKILHHLKYRNLPEIGILTGKWFGHSLRAAGYQDKFDLIIPVPLHKSKQRKRGYNQADYIAKGIAEVLEIDWSENILQRKVNTQTQTKKSRAERFSNTENIYAIQNQAFIKEKRILIIDDVITTGATVGQCADLVLKEGGKEVSVAALAAAE